MCSLIALAAAAQEPAPLAARHREFLDQVELLLQPEERLVFLSLRREYQREAFVRAFWRAHDPFPATARNELLESMALGLAAARDRFDDLADERARHMILHGPPLRTETHRCDFLRPLEVWHYRESALLRGEFTLVFLQLGSKYQLWRPAEGLFPIVLFASSLDERDVSTRIAEECTRGDQLLQAFSLALDWERLREASPLLRRANPEWARSFLLASTDLPDGALPLQATLALGYPGRHQSRTVLQATVQEATSKLADQFTGADPAERVVHFLLDGEVLRNDELFESFRYRFDLPYHEGQEPLPLVVERYLRPGDYRLVLKVRELGLDRYWRLDQQLVVPLREPPASVVHEPALAAVDPLREANTTLGAGVALTEEDGEVPAQPAATLLLRPPGDQLLVGRVRIEAVITGEHIARVAFALDDRPVMSKARPPYSVELDLGTAPRMRRLQAVALDSSGAALARDELVLNAGPHRFDVRLIEPQRGRAYRHSVRAAAEVHVPELERLDRVEFYLNQALVATVYQPPFVQPILIPAGRDLAYVRVVGYLEGGATAEDVVFVNAPDLLDVVEVSMVELYTTVLDRRGETARDLVAEDFRVFEDGTEQRVRRFEPVRDLAIHAGILLDVSTSMEDRLDEASDAALYFFEQVLGARDRACLFIFSDRPRLVVPFTSQAEVLAGGLASLVAEGETALWDSVIFSLHNFSGLKGKRALIVLTDGEDSSSEYSFDEALDYARRSGVALYTIGIGIPTRSMDVRARLGRLSSDTGGDSYFIDGASELKRVYSRIEDELRAQFLLVYQSASTSSDGRFREVRIAVRRPGLKATTQRGYYP